MSAETQATENRSFFGAALAALSIRASREDLEALDWRHILSGLVLTWAMGAGRGWGDPGLAPILSLGFGWVLYLLAFAVLIWLILKPLAPLKSLAPLASLKPLASPDLAKLLALLALTMPLALIYVVPFEIIFDFGTVEDLDVRPLILIAVWPMTVALFYARRALSLDWASSSVAVLLPFCLVVALSALISAMPGLVTILAESIMAVLFGKPIDEAVMDEAMLGYVMWQVVFQLALAAFAGLLVAYGMLVYRHRKGLRAAGA